MDRELLHKRPVVQGPFQKPAGTVLARVWETWSSEVDSLEGCSEPHLDLFPGGPGEVSCASLGLSH